MGTDGVNYHIFRYEKGNPNLNPEESYQLDAGIHWGNDRLTIQFDPYLNYFPNYIYMNPTPNYYEGLQWYYYTQSRVIRCGFELQADWKILPSLSAEFRVNIYMQNSCQAKRRVIHSRSALLGRQMLPFVMPSVVRT